MSQSALNRSANDSHFPLSRPGFRPQGRAEDEIHLVEALGTFYFTDFDIEYFSKFIGSVKNKYEFTLYVHLPAFPG